MLTAENLKETFEKVLILKGVEMVVKMEVLSEDEVNGFSLTSSSEATFSKRKCGAVKGVEMSV